MASQPGYGPATTPAEVDAFTRFAAESFAVSVEEERRHIDANGPQHLRLLRDGGAVVAGLALLTELGQWYGGRRVPAVGIAGVATDPRIRGRGAGTLLLRAAVRELHAGGVPLAILYPATQPLYRRAGFEQAGGRWEIRAPAASLDLRDRTLPLRRVEPGDAEELAALHRACAAVRAGGLDRNRLLWGRVLGGDGIGTAVLGPGGIEGYVVACQQRSGDAVEMRLHDLVASTPAAATRLLTFLADHRHQVREVVWHGGGSDPLLTLVREQEAQVRLQQAWMLRIVDVPAALASRGWPAAAAGELHLEIFDEVVAENRGRFLLEVGGGTGRVRPGGEGRLKVHVRGLAPLYTGWLGPDALALTGLLEGPEADRRLAASLFAGPAPAMSDFF